MRAWMVFLAIVPACGFHSSPGSSNDASVPIEAAPDAEAIVQFGTFVKVEFLASEVPTTGLTWTTSDVAIDTDADPMCTTHNRNDQAARYCVVAATNITLGAGRTLTAHGAKPLVLLATTTFDLQGTIDVSSKRGSPPGAGASSDASCLGTAATGHSGGYGGSFRGQGGPGGLPVSTLVETAGMPASPVGLPALLRGGCSGGSGAMGLGMGGTGGSGGGAVAIIAATLNLNGNINVSGAGGQGGPADPLVSSGGGGGGSGGMIVLDAPSIVAGSASMIWLYANGGGGGEGGTPGTSGGTGAGSDGKESIDPTMAALGGNTGNHDGGSGGNGSYGSVQVNGAAAGTNAQNNGGGGAGGGGAGFIRTPPISGNNVTITPGPTPP